MEFEIELNWWLKDAAHNYPVDGILILLLKAIDSGGSLQQASRQCQVSYRHAWGLMEKWENLLGVRLIVKQRGRGTHVSEAGRCLLNAHQQIHARFSPELVNQATQLSQQLMTLQARDRTERLKLHASHGLAVNALRESMREQQIAVDLHFHGSLESLQALARGHCDIAGFHIPVGDLGRQIAPQYLALIDAEQTTLIYLVRRQQGLMMATGNPLDIHSLADLTRADLRFINRQRGSGTRLLLDQLLASENIDNQQIQGYEQEEFTHMAVAAMIASGAADCGFGIAAVAQKFALDFVPLCEEHYCLAIPNHRLSDASVKAMLETLKAANWRESLADLAGYNLSQSGQQVDFKSVFGRH